MAFPANFTAIDFETANRRRDSACQLAAVVVRDGQFAAQHKWMIRPDPFFFSAANIRIHGIRPEHVEQEPSFGELWDEIAGVLGDDCLIAHNASFDLGVLIGCLQRHRRALPELHFSCTRLIARQTWPERPRFGLKPLATWLGVRFQHHDALEDAVACAKVLLAAGISRGAESLEHLERQLRLERGKAGPWGIQKATRQRPTKRARGTRSPRRTRTPHGTPRPALRSGDTRPLRLPPDPFAALDTTHAQFESGLKLGDDADTSAAHSPDASQPAVDAPDQAWSTGEAAPGVAFDFQRVAIRAEFIQPLRGKQILICGELQTLTREQAIDLTRRGGGVPRSRPDSETNCVLVGSDAEPPELAALRQAGRPFEVLREVDFLRLLQSSR